MVQLPNPSIPECQGGVPSPKFPIGILIIDDHEIILNIEFKVLELSAASLFDFVLTR